MEGRLWKSVFAVPVIVTVVFVALMFVLAGCPTGVNPDDTTDDTTEATELTTGDGTTITVTGPSAVTIAELDAAQYPGAAACVIEITGTLAAGETAELSFHSDGGFPAGSSIAFYESGWTPVDSSVSGDGTTITATVGHYSVWSVILVEEVGPATISGTVHIQMGSEWMGLYGSNLETDRAVWTMLVDSETFDPVDGFLQVVTNVAEFEGDESGEYEVPYAFEDVPEGSYAVVAHLDVDGSMSEDGDEPQSYYGDGDLVLGAGDEEPGIDLLLTSVDLSGEVTLDGVPYSGEEIYVTLFSDGAGIEDPFPARFTVDPLPKAAGTAPTGYTVAGVPTGMYLVLAFVDTNDSGEHDMHDGEPFGIWTENLGEEPGMETSPVMEDRTDVDIVIDTVNTAPVVTITEPSDGAEIELPPVGGELTVSGSVSDAELDFAGEYIELAIFDAADVGPDAPNELAEPVMVDDAEIQGDGSWELLVGLSDADVGDYAIWAVVVDEYGAEGSDLVTFTLVDP